MCSRKKFLDGGSLWSSGVETGYEHLFGGVWYGRSSKNDFRELKFNAESVRKMKHAYHFAFTHIRFPVDDESDDEWKPDSPTPIFLLMVKVA